jgi:hypothetical protein
MIGTYPESEFDVFVDDAEEGATERVVTAEDIAAVDARIKAAVSGGAYADGLARHDDETGTPTDPYLRKQTTEGNVNKGDADAGQLVDKVLQHFDAALKMHADALTRRMDDLEEKMKRADKRRDGHFDEGEEGERKREKDEEPPEDGTEKEKAREVVASSHADSESESDALAMWRSRVDPMIGGLCQETPKSLSGESLRAYQERVLRTQEAQRAFQERQAVSTPSGGVQCRHGSDSQ